jgi:hypothetical protein
MMQKVREKWNEQIPMDPDGRKFSLKFPNSLKIECRICNATPKVTFMYIMTYAFMIMHMQDLYEIAFAFGSCLGPFRIYSIIPRQPIDYNGQLDAAVDALALAVEEADDANDTAIYHV